MLLFFCFVFFATFDFMHVFAVVQDSVVSLFKINTVRSGQRSGHVYKCIPAGELELLIALPFNNLRYIQNCGDLKQVF